MRKMFVGVAALLLAGCGGETYPVDATQAFLTLSTVGTSHLDPLPGGLSPVSVSFESNEADNKVQWLFSHEGDSLAKIVATVAPDGDSASTVAIEYIEGTAPDENWRNGKARQLIQTYVQQLVTEAVDAKMENREFDPAVRQTVEAAVVTASMGAVMNDVSSSMEEFAANHDKREREAKGRKRTNPANATKPSVTFGESN
jgi:hypothetical protein